MGCALLPWCESVSMLEKGIWMRLISGVIQITYGTIIYDLVSFFHVNRHLFTLAIIGYMYVFLTTILIFFTIECLRSVILLVIYVLVIYKG